MAYKVANGSTAALPLSIGEHVVLVRDGDAEYGRVKWIGRIPGYSHTMVGVEFDNPVGNGTGFYNGVRLFTAKMNHAAIVPVEGLLRAVDYDRETSDFGTLKKDLLVDIDDGCDGTTLWSAERSGNEKTGYLIDTGEGDNEMTYMIKAHDILIGTVVEVTIFVNITTPDLKRYGVVRWIGHLPGIEETMAGVELDTDLPYWVRCSTDGYYRNIRYFFCSTKRGVFVPLSSLHRESRSSPAQNLRSFNPLEETMPDLPYPWKLDNLHTLVGKPKGIQGKHNSCYMDATFFALFTASDAFDDLLSRPRTRADIELYDDIRTCLKFSIVVPLRWRGYVESESIMKLRRLMSHALPDMTGLTTEEKDPEELINALFGPILGMPPDIHLTSGQSSYICPLVFDDASPKVPLTSVQTLLERSFFCSNVQLRSVPNRFIVQVPRYGKQKLYDYIVPSLRLDLSNILANRGRLCSMCGSTAKWQCKECYLVETNDYSMTFFCSICFGRFHSSLPRNNDHQVTALPRVAAPLESEERPYLELSSAICIESSHYVSYARVRDGDNVKWIFFDSMADREGGDITGQNLPQVVGCDEYFDEVLKPENRHLLVDALPLPLNRSERRRRFLSNPLPPFLERLLQDCYICIYVRGSQ